MAEPVLPEQDDDATRIVTPSEDSISRSEPGHDDHRSESRGLPPGGVASPASDAPDDSHATDLLAVGSEVSEFRITRVIGQGGFGVVYEAWDHTLERIVAIKEYLPTSLSTRQPNGSVVPLSQRHRETFDLGMRSFINEARLLAQFDHPSLVKVYRFWQERGTTYMVMPFYRGETLRHAFSQVRGAVDERWLLSLMDGITQALSVMHAANCYHRDIAPDNIILLESTGRPVVLDFGAARRVITDQTQAMTVILKPGYAPIEQYAEMPDMRQGPWTDVYALAAVLHVAVRGHAPPPSVARMMSDGYMPVADSGELRERFSPRLLAAIDAGLALRPADRPQSMLALRKMLGLEAGTDDAPLPASAVQAARPAGARPGAAVVVSPTRAVPARRGMLAALVGIAAVAAGAAWWWQAREAGHEGPRANASSQSAPSAAAPPEPQVAAPSPAPVPPASSVQPPRSPSQSLQALAEGADRGFGVVAKPRKSEVTIGKDRLSFEVRSARDGYVYVYMLSSNGELFLMFPNLLDKYNKLAAGTTLTLPRASWPLDAGGPAGTDEFVVVVSEHERDLAAAGLRTDGVFPQFSLPVLAALEAARGQGPTPLLGKPVCPGGGPACKDAYGVADFRIIEK